MSSIFNYDKYYFSYLNIIRILESFYLICRVNVVFRRVVINRCYLCFISFALFLNIKYLMVFRNLFVVCSFIHYVLFFHIVFRMFVFLKSDYLNLVFLIVFSYLSLLFIVFNLCLFLLGSNPRPNSQPLLQDHFCMIKAWQQLQQASAQQKLFLVLS